MYGISFFILTFVPNMQTNIFFTTINTKTNMKALLAIAVASLFCMSAYANPGDGDGDKNDLTKENVQPTLADYFSPVSKNVAKPDAKGFIRRWLLLEPIDKPNRSNTVFTDTYIRENFSQQYFPGQFTDIPTDGKTERVGEQELKWHAFDATRYNVKLFSFASGLEKQVYGVLFWAVTIIDSPEDVSNVRLAVGSNSASMWWLNGEEAVILSGDRRMVVDDVMSGRLNLKKGKNVLRGAVINGPGMSDFCVRFIKENGEPLTNVSVTLTK
jgi:hypothetical protein